MTECGLIVSRHLEYLKEGFWCDEEGEHTCVTTPYQYPDGSLIQVYVQEGPTGRLVVSDLAETARHIVVICGKDLYETQSGAISRIVNKYQILLDNGELIALSTHLEVGQAIFRLSMAMKEIADLVHTAKAQREIHFVDEVRNFMQNRRLPFVPRYPIAGRTGMIHRIDFLLQSKGGLLVQVIGQQGRKNKVNETYMIYNDLLEAGNTMPKIVLAEKTLPRHQMELLRSKADPVLVFDRPTEVLSAIG